MNNKIFKKVALASLVAASAFASSMASATEPTTLDLQVKGSIASAPCSVQLSDSSLELGSPLISDLKTSSDAPGTFAKPLKVTITDCEAINAAIDVIGTADSADNTILANAAATNAATNVGIAVWNDRDNAQYQIGGDSVKTEAAITTLEFSLVKADAAAAVTAGDVLANAQVKVSFL